jgi:hypothetical protein
LYLIEILVQEKSRVRVVFCDISKAFDRVWHKGLIHKLKQSGISGNLLKWFQNYLYGREQRVVINAIYFYLNPNIFKIIEIKIVTSAYIYITLYIQNNPTPRFVRTPIFSKWSLIIL